MSHPDIFIHSVGTALPGPAIDNQTLAKKFDAPSFMEEWIDTFVGTRQRHFAVDLGTGEVRYTLADLGVLAAQRALRAATVRGSDVDLVVMATSSPDDLMPATVNIIADRLGIDRVPTFQLQSGCAGAVQALDVAHHMLRDGRRSRALVLGADSCAKHLDLSIDTDSLAPEERINGLLFGDGAGALVLSTTPSPGAVAIRDVFVQLVGLNRPPGQIVEWRGRANRGSVGPAVTEDYRAVEESVPVLAAEAMEEMLETLGWQEAEIDYLLPPQLSGRMTARITERLGVRSAKEISCVADTGNTGNALPFFQLERALPHMVTGDRALAIAIESSKWIKAGFALEKA